jgi:hypothetical protein
VKGEDQRQGIIYPNITINDNLSLHLSFSGKGNSALYRTLADLSHLF